MEARARTILGPELIWLALYAVTLALATLNNPPTDAGNQRLELVGWFLPVIGVAVSFAPLGWMKHGRWWCSARIVVSGAVGVSVVVTKLCTAMLRGDSRDAGVGAGWMLSLSFGFFTLIAGAVMAAAVLLVLRWRSVRSV